MSVDPLRDDLGVELEKLLAIEPLPELPARIRERIAAERITRWGAFGWPLAGVAAVAALVTIALAGLQNDPATVPLPVVAPSNVPAISVPVLPLDVALSLALPPPSQRAVRNERVAQSFPVLTMPALEPLTEISIEPVAIEPLSAIAPLLGEHP